MDPFDRVSVDTAGLAARLEPSQRVAVLAREPVICVLAGAGTGKTRVLTLRVARRVEDGSAHPAHVLVCTFSRKAAAELGRRLWGLGVGNQPQVGTLHRSALRLITQHRADRGLAPPVILPDRRRVLAELVRADGAAHRWRGAARAPWVRVDAEIGWAKAQLVGPEGYEELARRAGRRPPLPAGRVAELYARYEEARVRRGALDLDDLVWHCVEVLEGDAGFRNGVRWWHRHVFVDEAQDLNEAQFQLLRLLVGDDPDLFVVGDPDQSVYGWNGADPAILDRIAHQFAGTRVLRLRENHRCSPQVLGVAVAALGGGRGPSSTRPDGPVPRLECLRTDDEEARWVARQAWLAHRPGRRWSSIAVLARTNAQLARLAQALEAERVPYHLTGSELGPASDVGAEDLHATDPPAGTEPVVARRGEAIDPGSGGSRGVGPSAARVIDGPGGPARQTQREGRADEATDAPGADGEGGSAGAGDDERSDAVAVSTFHRAKGLQWAAVIVAGLSDGLVPLVTARTRAAKDEERRLLYVALTRAEDELSCSWALHPDDAAASAAAPPRRPSPWLEAVQEAIAGQRAEGRETGPDRAAGHLARLRALVAEASGAADGHDPATRSGQTTRTRQTGSPRPPSVTGRGTARR